MDIKEIIQLSRGKPGKRIYITSPQQAMPKQHDWLTFLNNSEYKTELIQFLVSYYKKEHVRAKLTIPLIITEGENTWQILPNSVQKLNDCNHHEADTRI